MNSHQIKHDGIILIPERGLVYFIIITACLCFLTFMFGYHQASMDIENKTLTVAHLYMEGYRDSLAINRALADFALMKAEVALTCWKRIKAKEYPDVKQK